MLKQFFKPVATFVASLPLILGGQTSQATSSDVKAALLLDKNKAVVYVPPAAKAAPANAATQAAPPFDLSKYPYGRKFWDNPTAKCAPEDQQYKDVPGNEFYVKINGKDVRFDADDIMMINHPKDGTVVPIPRQRFFSAANAQLPAIRGAADYSAPQPGQETGVVGTQAIAKHLTTCAPTGHGIPMRLLAEAWTKAGELRGIKPPANIKEVLSKVSAECSPP